MGYHGKKSYNAKQIIEVFFIEKIKVITDFGEFEAEILNKNPKTTASIIDNLPLEAEAIRWGDEIYFETPIEVEHEEAQEIVGIGDLAFWPPGNAFCIFFGLTPKSEPDKIKPASAVNVFGKVKGDVMELKNIQDNELVRIEKFENKM